MWIYEDGHAPAGADMVVGKDTPYAVLLQPGHCRLTSLQLLLGKVGRRSCAHVTGNLGQVIFDSRDLHASSWRNATLCDQEQQQRNNDKSGC
jgi:hypothetical protein